jgi:hypothetical protein
MQKYAGYAQQEKECVDGGHFLTSQHNDGQKCETDKGQQGGYTVKRHNFTSKSLYDFIIRDFVAFKVCGKYR